MLLAGLYAMALAGLYGFGRAIWVRPGYIAWPGYMRIWRGRAIWLWPGYMLIAGLYGLGRTTWLWPGYILLAGLYGMAGLYGVSRAPSPGRAI